MTAPDSHGQSLARDELGRARVAPDDVQRWIAQAHGGCESSMGHLADRCRRYLLLIANQELDDCLRSKVGASDVVQEALLTAQQSFGRFQGTSEAELRLWVRRILLNKIAHTSRFYTQVDKRDIRQEERLNDNDSRGDDRFGLIDQAMTPCGNAIANERNLAIEGAIERLQQNHQQVIALRSFERQSFESIGQTLQISADAARKLWCRAIERLGQEWGAGDESR